MKWVSTFWPIIIVAFALTIFAGLSAAHISNLYYQHYSFDPDPSSGLVHNIQVYKHIQKNGQWATFWEELGSNSRDPFAYAPLILFAPALLKSKSAHLFVLLPYFFLFLVFLGYRIMMYSGAILSIALQISFATVLVIFAPYFGIGFHLPDAIASYPLALAGLSLSFWTDSKKLFWVFVFAGMISLAVLTRYIFSVYSFAVFAPILFYQFYCEYRKNGSITAIIRPLIIIGGVITLACGYFILKNLDYNLNYYTYWASKRSGTLNHDIAFSLKTFFLGYGSFYGPFHALILFAIVACFFFRTLWTGEKRWFIPLTILFWSCMALPFIWTVLLKSNGLKVTSSFLAAFPLTFAAISDGTRALPYRGRWQVAISAMIILLSSFSFIRYYGKAINISLTETPKISHRKLISKKIADVMNRVNYKEIMLADLSSDYLAEASACELFYGFKKIADVSAGHRIFQQGGQFWETNYSNKTDGEISQTIVDKINATCNVIIMNTDLLNSEKSYETNRAYQVASQVKAFLVKSNRWAKRPIINVDQVEIYLVAESEK
jgi:hypothetical protein